MNRPLKFFVCCMVCVLLVAAPAAKIYALPVAQADAIQRLLDDAVRISGTPGISAAVIYNGQTHYFNAGHTSRNNRSHATLVNEHTLYEIGSLSKAFTAVGILLLEAQGLLSTTDYIQNHLPWFYVTYQNEVAPVTIQQLLNHTSGLTQTHNDAPRGEGPDMLRRTVEPFVGARLDFVPGTAYAYGNANYNILGLVIEAVSGQSYESFMVEEVLEPLGLHQTFLYHSQAAATGRMAQGHRHAFFRTFTFDAPIYGGMKPTGFIISSAYDMARWMGIHLGTVQDIPEIFLQVVERAHEANIQGPNMGNPYTFYVGGWINRLDNGILNHAGATPNFLSNVLLFTEEKQGVVFLSNGGNVDFDLVWDIKDILDGDLQRPYTRSSEQWRDIMLSAMIIVSVLTMIYELVAGIRNRIKYKPVLTKSKIIWTTIWAVGAAFFVIRLLRYPASVGSGWAHIFDWNPPTITIALFLMPLFFAATAWHTYTKNPKPVEK
jgi:CubicO group peptidase (beta-lactamase class C family)